MLNRNLMFEIPEEIIEKLMLYQMLGVDKFIYYAHSQGFDHGDQGCHVEARHDQESHRVAGADPASASGDGCSSEIRFFAIWASYQANL